MSGRRRADDAEAKLLATLEVDRLLLVDSVRRIVVPAPGVRVAPDEAGVPAGRSPVVRAARGTDPVLEAVELPGFASRGVAVGEGEGGAAFGAGGAKLAAGAFRAVDGVFGALGRTRPLLGVGGTRPGLDRGVGGGSIEVRRSPGICEATEGGRGGGKSDCRGLTGESGLNRLAADTDEAEEACEEAAETGRVPGAEAGREGGPEDGVVEGSRDARGRAAADERGRLGGREDEGVATEDTREAGRGKGTGAASGADCSESQSAYEWGECTNARGVTSPPAPLVSSTVTILARTNTP